MTFASWLRGLTCGPAPTLKKSHPSAPRARGSRHRPSVERLEDRSLPSAAFGLAFELGGTAYEAGQDIAVDAAGSMVVVGTFSGTMDADPSSGVALLTATSAYRADAFVAKYDAAGSLLWARRMGGTEGNEANSVAVDAAGNVLVTGTFTRTADFGSTTLNSTGLADAFLTKLDANGTFLWARGLTGNDGLSAGIQDAGEDVAVDGSGNIYTTGSLSVDDARSNLFASKHDAGGQLLWSHHFVQLNTTVYGSGIAVDSAANVYVTGQFAGQVDFNPGTGTFTLSSTKSKKVYTSDAFIWSLDTAGTFRWAGGMGGQGNDFGQGVAVDPAGRVCITGAFGGTTNGTAPGSSDFDPGAGTYALSSAGSYDVFVVKLNASRNFLWARRLGGSGSEEGTAIALDGLGNVYTAGSFGPTSADFDPGAGTYLLSSSGDKDIFVSKLDGSGNFAWAARMGGTAEDRGEGIAVDGSGNVYTTGFFRGTADFDPAVGTYFLTSTPDSTGNPSQDVFVSKLVPLSALQAAGGTAPHAPGGAILSEAQVTPLLTPALARWQAAGVNTSALDDIDIRIADLGGTTIGLAAGNTIWLDDNAAGWGWFVDATPASGSEFTMPGNQGEQNRMDLLTVLTHEVGHLLGQQHQDRGVMHETLAAGTRVVSSYGSPLLGFVDQLFADDLFSSKKHRRHHP